MSYIKHFHGEIVVDIDEVGGDTIHTFTYNRGAAPMTVIRDIMAYFENGTIPKKQPEYRQFLYQQKPDPWQTANADQALSLYESGEITRDEFFRQIFEAEKTLNPRQIANLTRVDLVKKDIFGIFAYEFELLQK